MNRVDYSCIAAHLDICPTHVGMNRESISISAEPGGICPTHVGMNRPATACILRAIHHLPHARGDEPLCFAVAALIDCNLPHARGDEPGEQAKKVKSISTSSPRAWG